MSDTAVVDGAVDCGEDVVAVVTGAALLPEAAEVVPVLVFEPQGVIVVVLHDAVRRFLMRPHSLLSMLSFQRALIATQSAKYVQRYALFFGIQFEGSLSLFD